MSDNKAAGSAAVSNPDRLLTINNLHIEGQSDAGWLKIVDGVSLTLNRGEVLGLIGESGAGKSTLGLAAMGYRRDGCRISAGEIIFDGIDLRNASERKRRALRGSRIAYVAQSAAASFNPAYRLMTQYCEAPMIHGLQSRADAARDAVELYKRMRLPNPTEIGFRFPHQVSGGQLQRAMTAMAMSCRPDLIVFDEPTTALDVTTQIEVLAAIRDIVRQSNTAAIYITHDLAVVAQMADRIKVLRHGKEVEEAKTREMVANPKEPYTKTLWAVRNHLRSPTPVGNDAKPALMQVAGVSASYGNTPVLHDINLTIHPGRTLGLVGESGSGKSTLGRVISGLLAPSQGSVRLSGEALPAKYGQRSKEQLREVQYIYQMADTALNPRHRIRELLGWPVQFYTGLKGRKLEERIRQLLRMIDMDPDKYIDRYSSELSGGQKQRIGIARALAAEPRLIICDEVTSALDQIVAEGILQLLDRLQKEFGLAFIFITHDLNTVRAIADEVIVMKQGRVVESGPTAEVYAQPREAYTKLLLASVPQTDPEWLDKFLERPRKNLNAAEVS